jgi:hypothetical protein
VRSILFGGLSFALFLGGGRVYLGAESSPHFEGLAPSSSGLRPEGFPERSTAAAAPASVGAAMAPHPDGLNLSALSQMDQAILTDSSEYKSQRLFLARHYFLNAVTKWVLKERTACPGIAAADPSFLRVDVELDISPGRASVAGLKSISVARGAPLDEEALSCLAAQLRRSIPYVVPKAAVVQAQFAGDANFLVEVNSSCCRAL